MSETVEMYTPSGVYLKRERSTYLFYYIASYTANYFVEVRWVERFVRQPKAHVVHALRKLTHSLRPISISIISIFFIHHYWHLYGNNILSSSTN